MRNASSSGRADPAVMMCEVRLQPGPGARPALDQVDRQHGVHGALHRHPAGLALALPGVAVAEREQRALHVDPEVAGDPGPHLGGVHVAAERVGHQGAAHLQVGRRDPDRAVHGVHRQVHRVVALPGGEPAGAARAVELPHPDQFRQRLVQQRGGVGGRQRAEQRHGGGRAPVPGGLDRDEVHGQRVAGLRALDVERAGLRVEVGELAHLRDQVVLPAHLAREAVLGEHLQDRRRRDAGQRAPRRRTSRRTGRAPAGA